jgi:ribonuclease T1
MTVLRKTWICAALVLTLSWSSSLTVAPAKGLVFRPGSNIPVVAIDRLPIEAQQTVKLINQGGPFPFRQDGTVFGNRERRLPIAPRGTYREYTVVTPGRRDRGARRIVTGLRVKYYTADHYRSFQRVQE